MENTLSASRLPRWPARLFRRVGCALVMITLIAGCTAPAAPATQPAPLETEPAAPTAAATQPVLANTSTSTALSSPTSAPPTSTTAPPNTPAPTSTLEPTLAATAMTTDTTAPTETTGVTAQPQANAITFQIKNDTIRDIFVYGYGTSRLVPSGMTVYYPAPAWGEITLKVCHKNKDNKAGGCYMITTTISEKNSTVEITKS